MLSSDRVLEHRGLLSAERCATAVDTVTKLFLLSCSARRLQCKLLRGGISTDPLTNELGARARLHQSPGSTPHRYFKYCIGPLNLDSPLRVKFLSSGGCWDEETTLIFLGFQTGGCENSAGIGGFQLLVFDDRHQWPVVEEVIACYLCLYYVVAPKSHVKAGALKLATDLGISDRVKFHGWLPRNEALAQGLPIVSLDHCGFSEAVNTGSGIKVPVTTPAKTIRDIVGAIAKLERDEALRYQLACAALKRAADFSWESKIAVLRSVYDIGLDRQDSKCL